MRNFPHGGEVLGASPANPLLAPVLRPAPVLNRQQALLDLQAIQRIPGLAGYWPADPAYLYEDSAGTIPASVNGVVGAVSNLIPATYGPNLVSNGTFDTVTTGWTAYTGTIAQENGELKLINGAASPWAYAYTPITTEVGATYYVTATEHSESANNMVSIFAGITPNGNSLGVDPGDYTASGSVLQTLGFTFIASGTTTYIGAGNRGLANAIGYLDNVVVRKVLTGVSAIQSTTANKPYLRRTPRSSVYWRDSNTIQSALTATLGNLGSSCTVVKSGAEGVTFTEGVTISSTYNIAQSYGFNSDVAIFDRALTTSEKALLTRYMQRSVPVLGANLVTNGTFDTNSNWTTATGWSIDTSDKVAVFVGGTAGYLSQTGVMSTGKQYRFSMNVVENVASMSVYYIGSPALGSPSTTGAFALYTQATATGGTELRIRGNSTNPAQTSKIDDVIVQEIL